jgi:acyl-CoA hydrolase
MSTSAYPKWFSDCVLSNEEALRRAVRSHMTVGSGFATSEPHTFYDTLWDHITRHDIHDLDIRNALFMAPHRLCVGSALEAKGLVRELTWGGSVLASAIKRANAVSKKVQALSRLIDHYRELERRRITFTSAFIGSATNLVIPSTRLTRYLYPEHHGRNTTRMGITRMQSIHFPDAINSMAFDPDNKPMVDTFVAVVTPPNAQGDMSHGTANGANGEVLEKLLELKTCNLILYVNGAYPFTTGYQDAPNTVNINVFEGLAQAGKLFVVEDSGRLPALPKGHLDNVAPEEEAIARNALNHIELNRRFTNGRALQVGFGGTGALVTKGLRGSSWTGRVYTEMLEPFTMDLFESGKIAGSHFVEKDGRRTSLDGKVVCTFTICEQGSDFYKRLDKNPAVVLAPASRVVISEAFHHGLGLNSCLSIDFHGHVNSGGRDSNHYSGIGGGATIMRGMLKGGVGYLLLKSVHRTPEGELRSSIFPYMPQGTPVAYIGPDLMGGRDGARFFLVTEHGVAQISGRNQHDFIRALISVADPRFRDHLKWQAWQEFRVRA